MSKKKIVRKWWVGHEKGSLKSRAFYSNRKPTLTSHGEQYDYVEGPFTREEAETWRVISNI